jgi:hypothetical protein
VCEVTSALLAGLLLVAIVVHLARLARARRDQATKRRAANAARLAAIIDNVTEISGDAAGVTTWAGMWRGQRVQVRTIVDTLAVRKLPAYWLSVTVTEKVAIPGVFDMMMRPGSPTTFSNFDHLPYTVPLLPRLPDGAVVRTDQRNASFPRDTIAAHLGLFAEPAAKELLITPNGVRIVWLLAEAERARYGVFRQAEFAGADLDAELVGRLLQFASSLREAVNLGERQAA